MEFPEKAWDFNTISWGLKSVDPVMRQRVFEFAVANPHIAYTTGLSYHAPKWFIIANPTTMCTLCLYWNRNSRPIITRLRRHTCGVQIQSMFRRYKATACSGVEDREGVHPEPHTTPITCCRRKMKRCANEYGTIDSDERVQKKRKISLHWDGQDIVP
jgi:hypothetical protein